MDLLIRPNEITQYTPMGGNVDVDKYTACIFDAQMTDLQPILGDDLYNKIATDFKNDALTGDYLILYNDYVKPFLRHAGAKNYFGIGAFMINNGGMYKHTAENAESMTASDIDGLFKRQESKVEVYHQRMIKWLKGKNLPEFKCMCGTNTVLYNGWHL